MLQRLIARRRDRQAGDRLYAACVAQARAPALYREMGVPDRIDARFELYLLHVVLVMDRLEREGDRGEDVSRALLGRFVSQLDDALREIGVGDLAVGKKMRKLGEAIHGRWRAYQAALAGEGDPLETVLSRNVLGEEQADASALAAYAAAARDRLAAQALDDLLRNGPNWPEVAR
ncbi:ubiquinol-cytochrome C chaperone family protein [Brevundimonas sp. 2R-24]|uniref:Ubiquinol-cytochrome C chaperone family protein n=1 Tax=Peiella sedimenti TaxID=3061083 RepID=A0ABT8SL34_9CAUL|nr:ubiquinol-cytochrome C chaperone family protein [Caulobacteraceae bacterium XZ-24]